jgi:hypothetical protein
VKISARIVRHGRYVVFQLAELAVARALFARSCAGSMACGHRRRRSGDEHREHHRQQPAGEVRPMGCAHDREPSNAAESGGASCRTMALRDWGRIRPLQPCPPRWNGAWWAFGAVFAEFLVELIQVSVDHRLLRNRYTLEQARLSSRHLGNPG